MILRYWKNNEYRRGPCGNIHRRGDRDTAAIHVSKLSAILDIMIPFFDRYPLQGSKKVNYQDFCPPLGPGDPGGRVVFMLRDRAHLTKEGCEVIAQIKSGMNKQRVYEVPEDSDTLNVVRGSDMFRKRLYLYDASTLELIKTFSMQRDLLSELSVSPKTITKYQDTGVVFRGKYIITTKPTTNGATGG